MVKGFERLWLFLYILFLFIFFSEFGINIFFKNIVGNIYQERNYMIIFNKIKDTSLFIVELKTYDHSLYREKYKRKIAWRKKRETILH